MNSFKLRFPAGATIRQEPKTHWIAASVVSLLVSKGSSVTTRKWRIVIGHRWVRTRSSKSVGNHVSDTEYHRHLPINSQETSDDFASSVPSLFGHPSFAFCKLLPSILCFLLDCATTFRPIAGPFRFCSLDSGCPRSFVLPIFLSAAPASRGHEDPSRAPQSLPSPALLADDGNDEARLSKSDRDSGRRSAYRRVQSRGPPETGVTTLLGNHRRSRRWITLMEA